jgi:hypothetical protein
MHLRDRGALPSASIGGGENHGRALGILDLDRVAAAWQRSQDYRSARLPVKQPHANPKAGISESSENGFLARHRRQ